MAKTTRAAARGRTASKAGGGKAASRRYEQKTLPTGGDVQAFLDGVEGEERRADCRALVRMMERVTGEPPRMWGGSIVGFGSYHYRYASGHEGDCSLAGFSPRKTSFSLYLLPGFEARGELMRKLGKHKSGKGCLYIQRLADVDSKVLERLVRESVRAARKLGPSAQR